jgi:hypothetical protein
MISTDFNVSGQLLIIHSTSVKYILEDFTKPTLKSFTQENAADLQSVGRLSLTLRRKLIRRVKT